MNRHLRFTVSEDKAGVPLLAFLSARFAFFSADAWRDRIAAGRVRINGKPADPAALLRFRDLIEYLGWDIPEPPVNRHVECLHRDEDLVAVLKPAGLPCHPGGRFLRNTLTAVLAEDFGIGQPTLINRLDRETSGIVIVAPARDRAKRLQSQFASRSVVKRYTVFVEGAFTEERTARGTIGPDTVSVVYKRRVFVPRDDTPAETSSDWAVTRFRPVASNGGVSEVEAHPETGRMHQIRATLSALGFPIVGDKLYGVDPNLFLRFCDGTLTEADHARLRIGRQALHAGYLRLRHPRNGRILELEAPLPDDLVPLRRLAWNQPYPEANAHPPGGLPLNIEWDGDLQREDETRTQRPMSPQGRQPLR